MKYKHKYLIIHCIYKQIHMYFMKIPAVDLNNIKKIITNNQQLFLVLKKNLINEIVLDESIDIDICKEILELLKTTNTSVKTIRLNLNFDLIDNNEYCTLLYDMLINNTYLNTIYLKHTQLSIANFKSICEVLKNNISISNFYLYCTYFERNIRWEEIIEALKFNNSLKRLSMHVNAFCTIDGKHIVELLKNNNTISNIKMNSFRVTNSDIVLEALKDNTSIVEFNVFNMSAIDKYIKRNAHNTRLKAMTLEDL
jgi:hypothetical protein